LNKNENVKTFCTLAVAKIYKIVEKMVFFNPDVRFKPNEK
jgi:hypothetical protein